MPATVSFTARKASVYCPEHQDGLNGVSKAKAQIWADVHNKTCRPAAPEVDESLAPGNAREIPAELDRPGNGK